MDYVLITLVGILGGGLCVFLALANKRRELDEQKRQQMALTIKIQQAVEELKARQTTFEETSSRLDEAQSEFQTRVIAYKELQDENAILRTDLRNIDVSLRKTRLDAELQEQTQLELDQRIVELGSQYLKDTVTWISRSLNPNNFTACKERLQDVIDRCRSTSFKVSSDEERALIASLKTEYEKVVRNSLEREEQARIKALIREEQAREREINRELKQLEWEREAIQAALSKALAEAEGRHSEEVETLKSRLAEAEEKSLRAISQAQLTKAGHVYVISNIGSFGEGIFKVGMTRRLEPMDRICELSAASVPFPFDVHMMISTNDAPALEWAMHKALHKARINRANPRKEFFKTDIDALSAVVKQHHGEIEYVVDAPALEYRQSLNMSEEDQEFIETVYEGFEDDNDEEAVSDCNVPQEPPRELREESIPSDANGQAGTHAH